MAFDHQNLIWNQITDVFCIPLDFYENGGFTASSSGNHCHNVGIYEAHEMLINKHTKFDHPR